LLGKDNVKTNKQIGLEINTDKTKYTNVTRNHHNMIICSKLFRSTSKLYLGTFPTERN